MLKDSAESVEFVGQATMSSNPEHSYLPKIDAPGNSVTVSFPALVISLGSLSKSVGTIRYE